MSALSQAAPQLSPDGESYWDGLKWVSLLSPDGMRLWDGRSWVPRATRAWQPQASSTSVANPVAAGSSSSAEVGGAAFGRPPRTRSPIKPLLIAGGALAAIVVMALGAYALVTIIHPYAYIKVTGANSIAELAAEQTYDATYNRDTVSIQADTAPLVPTSTSPGVCNKGGTKQGCYDTDQKVTRDFRAMLNDLSRLTVPPRFTKGDADLRRGLQLSIDGFALRDQAIASADPNASFTASNQKLQEALVALHLANSEFPADNAPQPKF